MTYTVTGSLHVELPFCAEALLAYLGARLVPRVEELDGHCYRRTLHDELGGGLLEVDLANASSEGHIRVTGRLAFPGPMEPLMEAASSLVDATADPAEASFLETAASVGPSAVRWRGIRIPGTTNAFELAVRAIIGQQISVRAAATLAGRLALRYGATLPDAAGTLSQSFPRASDLATAPLEDSGLPRQRAAAVRAFECSGCLGLASPRSRPKRR